MLYLDDAQVYLLRNEIATRFERRKWKDESVVWMDRNNPTKWQHEAHNDSHRAIVLLAEAHLLSPEQYHRLNRAVAELFLGADFIRDLGLYENDDLPDWQREGHQEHDDEKSIDSSSSILTQEEQNGKIEEK